VQIDDAALVIAGMAFATYGVRASGFMLAGRLPQSGIAARWLKQIPAAILVSIVAPAAVAGGAAGLIAAAVTVLTAALSRNLLLAMSAGVGSVWLLRQVL